MASLYVLCPCRTRCTTLRPRTKMGKRRWLDAAATSSAVAAVRPSLIVLSDRCSELASSCPGDMMYCEPPSSPGESATSSYAEGSMEVSRVGVWRTASGTCAAARGSIACSSAPRFERGDVTRSSASSRASLRIRVVFRGRWWWTGRRARGSQRALAGPLGGVRPARDGAERKYSKWQFEAGCQAEKRGAKDFLGSEETRSYLSRSAESTFSSSNDLLRCSLKPARGGGKRGGYPSVPRRASSTSSSSDQLSCLEVRCRPRKAHGTRTRASSRARSGPNGDAGASHSPARTWSDPRRVTQRRVMRVLGLLRGIGRWSELVRFVRLGSGLFGERLARPFTERRAVAVHRADPRRPDATTVLAHQRCRRPPACLPRTISGLV